MRTKICDMVGVDFPLFAFSHCRDVVAAVTNAGGVGVLGAVGFTPEQLKMELDWIDGHVGGRPYGVDVAIPENMAIKGETGLTSDVLWERIPDAHRRFADDFLVKFGVDPPSAKPSGENREMGLMHDTAERSMDVVFQHPVRLVVQALGIAPQSLIDRGRAHGVPIGALIGSAEHARRQVEVGVEILVAQGTEAGGHCGEITTMVLVPEVV